MNELINHKNYFQLFIRARILSVIAFSVMPIILVSGIILYQFKTSYYEKVFTHLETLVKKHKLNVDAFLNEKLGDIRFVADTHSLKELSEETFLNSRLEALQRTYGPVFVDLGVINSEGVQLAYAGPFKLGKAMYADADWFDKAMHSEYVISDVFLGLRGLPHFIVAVREYSGGQPWILRATIDFAAFNDLVKNIRIGETGFAFILNRDIQLQTKPMLDIELNKGPYNDLLRRETGKEIDVRMDDGSGDSHVYVSTFLKNNEWLLVYQQRASDAFSDFQGTLMLSLIIIMLGSIGTITLAFVRFKNMAKSIEQAEREKKMMDEQIIETGKLASVGELAAGIAHEINNPVAIMVEEAGWIEDLLEEDELQKSENLTEFHRALRQIHTQGKRCKEITHKLLSFARKTETITQDVQINDLIVEVVELSAQRAKFRNVVINHHFQENIPLVKMSQSEMQQVFLNLINNALDAMEKEGGTIDIRTTLRQSNIVIEIADTGSGIPSANLSKIFDPFFTTKAVGKGTGLGLSICYGIIKKMGGEIDVQSEVNQGTALTIKIPFKKESKSRPYDSLRSRRFE